MNGRKRKIQIKFYVTEEERALIEQKMKLVPTKNMAAYLRKIAIDGYIIQTDHSDIKSHDSGDTENRGSTSIRLQSVSMQQAASTKRDIEEIKGCLRRYGGYKD